MDHRTIIDSLSAKMDLSRETIETLVDGLCKVFIDAGENLDSIYVPNFGNFESKKKIERVAVHPATGKKLLVPPRISYCFKPSPALKEKVNHE